MVHHDDQNPLVIINKVGFSQLTLTLLNFPCFHAFQDGDPRMIWASNLFNMEEPNEDERERAKCLCIKARQPCHAFLREFVGGFWANYGH